jgi:hypothetical protein
VTFCYLCRKAAKKRGLQLLIQKVPGGVVLQAIKPSDNGSAATAGDTEPAAPPKAGKKPKSK